MDRTSRNPLAPTLALTFGLTALAAGPLAAGVVFEVETKDHEHSPPRQLTTEVAAEGRNLKMGIAAGGKSSGGAMIYRGGAEPEMVVVDHDNKSYTVLDRAAIEAIAGQVGQVMGELEKSLEGVPEAQRAQLEALLKQRMPQQAPARPATTLRKTGERDTRAGYPCVKYEVLRGERTVRELWVTDWDNVEGGDEVAATFEEMAAFFRDALEPLTEVAGGLGAAVDESVFEHMAELDGFPVVTRDFAEDGSLESESELRSARRRTLDPAEFEPPAGYKRRQMAP